MIKFGKISSLLLFPLSYTIFCTLRGRSENLTPPKMYNIPFVTNILSAFGELSIGILEIISRIRQSSSNNRQNNKQLLDNKKTSLVNDSTIKKKGITIKTLLIIFGISLSNYIVCFIAFYKESHKEYKKSNYQNEFKFLGVIYLSYICVKLLKQDLGRHHIFSLLIIGICHILLSLVNIFLVENESTTISDYFISFLILLICDMYFSSKHCVERWVMQNLFISPYMLLFVEGIFSIIVNIIFMGILSVIPCKIDYCALISSMFSFSKFFEDIPNIGYYVLLFFPCSIGIELFITLTNLYLSPAYRPIFDALSSLISIFFFLNNINVLPFILKIVIYLIIVFVCLVFNEIIIISIWRLDENVKESVLERGKKDFENSINDIEIIEQSEREE